MVAQTLMVLAVGFGFAVPTSFGPGGPEPYTVRACMASTVRPDLRIGLTSFSDRPAVETTPIIEEVGRIWSRHGVRLAWIVTAARSEPPPPQDVDLKVHLLDARHRLPGTQQSSRWPVFGSVAFVDGQPQDLVRVSVSTLFDDLKHYIQGLRHPKPPVTAQRQWLERAVARTLAHEIGHIVLGSQRHSAEGRMRPLIRAIHLARHESKEFLLDAREQERLQEQVSASRANCASLYRRDQQ